MDMCGGVAARDCGNYGDSEITYGRRLKIHGFSILGKI